MTFEVGQLAQWFSVLVAVLVIMFRQTRIAGKYQEKIERLEKAVIGRLETLEKQAHGQVGDNSFVTYAHHKVTQQACQKHIEERMRDISGDIVSISKRLDRMDEKREDTRVLSDKRLTEIEKSITGLSRDIKYLTEVLRDTKRKENAK